jgi:hypothetical protein
MIAARCARLRVRQIVQFALSQPICERAQIRVLKHIRVGIRGVQDAELRRGGLDRRDLHRVGREPPLDPAHPPSRLNRRCVVIVVGLEDRVGLTEKPVHGKPDRLYLP